MPPSSGATAGSSERPFGTPTPASSGGSRDGAGSRGHAALRYQTRCATEKPRQRRGARCSSFKPATFSGTPQRERRLHCKRDLTDIVTTANAFAPAVQLFLSLCLLVERGLLPQRGYPQLLPC